MGYQALLFCPDEKTARNVTHVLNDLDFTVEPCTEPFAAVKKLMAQHFDAVVVDCDNEQNATLLFKSARNSSSNQSSLAVAVVEGQAGVAKAFRIGANLVLTKPINVEQAKGTLRVARGLLRKGNDPAKNVVPAASATPAVPVNTAATPARPSAAAPAAASKAATWKPTAPAVPTQKPVATPSLPAMVASAPVAEVDELDSDTILEADIEELTSPETASENAAPAPATGTSKFPWQPSAKMAEPMASALRRAAEAAGQVDAQDTVAAKPAAPPAAEKRVMSGAMFQAQGHAAAAAPAAEKPSAPPAPKLDPPLAISKTVVHEAPEPKTEKVAVDTTSEVAPPTFFPGAYDPDEVEGGGKTKAIVIVAAVVLLACSAGYLSLRNSGNKPATQAAASQSNPVSAAPAADTSSARETAAPAQAANQDITLGNSAPSPAAATHPTPSKPSPKQSAPEPVASAPAEPEVTQRLIVRSDTGHKTPTPAPQDQEAVTAPSAIGMGATADTKALASISSAPVNVPKPSAQTLRVSQGVMEGLVLKRVQPRYPTQAMQLRIQGAVQLQATISRKGDIENLKVVSGDAVLAHAAQEAVKQWKYKPYYLNGEPVSIETQILVNFKLPN
jgi:protein TonB